MNSRSKGNSAPVSVRFLPWLDAWVREEASLERRTFAEYEAALTATSTAWEIDRGDRETT
jgi:hypothetical protein